LTVTLTGDLNRLLKKPDLLRFQVVNPNDADGVPSLDKALAVVAPEIADASIQTLTDDTSQVRVVIQGANFRQGAMVEFFKVGMDGAPVIQLKPAAQADDRVIVVVSAKKLERLGIFRMRVVNPGTVSVASTLVQPRQLELATNED
jgi:hypothetical protein